MRNKKCGYGVYTFVNGDVYQGEFKDDEMHGYGLYTFSHEGHYEGQWVMGVYEGLGTETFALGSTYHGQYVEGSRNGWGVCRYYNGDYYEGQWREGLREGRGMQQVRKPCMASTGQCQQQEECQSSLSVCFSARLCMRLLLQHCTLCTDFACIHCFNIMLACLNLLPLIVSLLCCFLLPQILATMWLCMLSPCCLKLRCSQHFCVPCGCVFGLQCTDDSNFVGDYLYGKRHGYGIYNFPNGDRYYGEYVNDIPHGHGVYRFSNGQKYEGQWQGGKKHGFCVYTVETNGVWEKWAGEWEEGRPVWVESLSKWDDQVTSMPGDLRAKMDKVGMNWFPLCGCIDVLMDVAISMMKCCLVMRLSSCILLTSGHSCWEAWQLHDVCCVTNTQPSEW